MKAAVSIPTADCDDKNSLFRIERREFPNCVPLKYLSQDVAGPKIEQRPKPGHLLYFKCMTDNKYYVNSAAATYSTEFEGFRQQKPGRPCMRHQKQDLRRTLGDEVNWVLRKLKATEIRPGKGKFSPLLFPSSFGSWPAFFMQSDICISCYDHHNIKRMK